MGVVGLGQETATIWAGATRAFAWAWGRTQRPMGSSGRVSAVAGAGPKGTGCLLSRGSTCHSNISREAVSSILIIREDLQI